MDNIVERLSKLSLINRIVIGMGIGIFLGIFVPSLTVVGILGTVFVMEKPLFNKFVE